MLGQRTLSASISYSLSLYSFLPMLGNAKPEGDGRCIYFPLCIFPRNVCSVYQCQLCATYLPCLLNRKPISHFLKLFFSDKLKKGRKRNDFTLFRMRMLEKLHPLREAQRWYFTMPPTMTFIPP